MCVHALPSPPPGKAWMRQSFSGRGTKTGCSPRPATFSRLMLKPLSGTNFTCSFFFLFWRQPPPPPRISLVGMNLQPPKCTSAAVDLLVFGLPSLLFLRALVQNRPLRTETRQSKSCGLTSPPSNLRLAAPRPLAGGSSPLTSGGTSLPC